VTDVAHHADDRDPSRVAQAQAAADGIDPRPELACHGVVDDGHRRDLGGVVLVEVAATQPRTSE